MENKTGNMETSHAHIMDIPLSTRECDCGKCSMQLDRDINASINIPCKRMGSQRPSAVGRCHVMRNFPVCILAMVLVLALMPGVSAANGYGTSSISVARDTVSLAAGNSTTIGYAVNLASGSTWGTTLSVVNGSKLESSGITVSLSNPSGDPPYGGNMTVSVSSSTAPGNYTALLQATGDDPSANRTAVRIRIYAPSQAATPPSGAASTTGTSSAGNPLSTNVVPPPVSYSTTSPVALIAAVVVILLVAGYLVAAMRSTPARLDIIGIALILIGVVVWLYGDYNGGLMQYIWGGVAAILLGTMIWIIGDYIAGAFRRRR